ncbi:hypothetical protein [Serratia fonticola]
MAYQEKFAVSALANGAIDDKQTDCTGIIQQLINSINSGSVIIENGIKWNQSKVTLKNNVQIIDLSTYDYLYNNFGAQISLILSTDSPTTKNAHEFTVKARHHPAIIVDNIGGKDDPLPEGEEYRASFIIRNQGKLSWRIGSGSSATDKDFLVTGSDLSGRYRISQASYEQAWNSSLINGVDFAFSSSSRNEGDMLVRYRPNTDKKLINQYMIGSSLISQWSYLPDSTAEFRQGGSTLLKIGLKGQLYGNKKRVIESPSVYNLTVGDSNTIFKNGDFVTEVTLPSAEIGCTYDFYEVNNKEFIISTKSSDVFKGKFPGEKLTIPLQGNISVVCIRAGVWEFK